MSKNTPVSVEPNTPAEIKTRIPVWLYPSTLEVMDRAMKIANCKSRSEYLEKAALFYAGYVSGQDATAYLPPALASVLRGTVQDTENRICRLLFKLVRTPPLISLPHWRPFCAEQYRTRRTASAVCSSSWRWSRTW